MRSHPPQPGPPASPPAPVPASPSHPALGLLAALGFNLAVGLFAFSLWAEWGPYAWAVAAQMALGDSYRDSLAFLFTFCVFLAPAIAMSTILRRHRRAIRALAFAIPALALAAHFAVAVWFVWQGGQPDPNASFADSVRAAHFLPRAITLDPAQMPPLDYDHLTSFTKSRRRTRDGGDGHYCIPFVPTAWPDPHTPIYLTCRKFGFTQLSSQKPLTGIIHQGPFPYLVRRHSPSPLPTLGILIDIDDSVRTYWLLPVLLDIVCAAMAIRALARL